MSRRPMQLQRISRRGLISSAMLAGVLTATGVQVQARVRGGVLRLGVSGEAHSLAPGEVCSGMFLRVAGQGLLYETLTEITATGELKGELAESWEPSDGARVWVINLRRGIRFHDGRPVTAGDVVASFTGFRQRVWRGVLDFVTRITVLSNHQIRFELDQANVNFPLILADPHLIVAPGGVFDGIGSGLYRLAEFVPEERLRATRVEDHWKGDSAGWFDAVVLRALPDPGVRNAALLAGHVDAVDMPAHCRTIEKRRGFQVLRSETQGIGLFGRSLEKALEAGMDIIRDPPPSACGFVDLFFCEDIFDDCGINTRYGPWMEPTMQPFGMDFYLREEPMLAHMPLTTAHTDRLRHHDVGDLYPMDSGRIAQRWWFG